MKKSLIIIGIITLSYIAASINLQANPFLGDFYLDNIEALSTGETNISYCVGIGSLDCYRINTKVAYIW